MIMKRFMLALLLLAPQCAFAATPGTTIFDFLKLQPSTRSAGAGQTDGLLGYNSSLSNPAMMSRLKYESMSANYMAFYSDAGYSYSTLSYIKPDNDSAWGLNAGYMGANGIIKTFYDPNSIDNFSTNGTFSAYDLMLDYAYSKTLSETFSYGADVRFAREDINASSYNGIMAGLSGFYYAPDSNIQVGFGVQNIGPSVSGYSLPANTFLSLGGYIDVNLFFILEGIAYNDQNSDIRAGFEYAFNDVFCLRGGYASPLTDQQHGSGADKLTAGFGIRIGPSYTFDYAWLPYGDLGTQHRIGVSYEFNTENQDEKKRRRLNPEFEKKLKSVSDF